MKNFKEIVEKCLAGELSGTFILRNGDKIRSVHIIKKPNLVCSYWTQLYGFFSDNGNCYDRNKHYSEYDIIGFIPDNMQELKITIPEGKVPVMEQTENGVVITWKEKELTYNQIYQSIYKNDKAISSVNNTLRNDISDRFLTKTNVLRKLLNIRNYFGKPNEHGGFIITPTIDDKGNHKIIFGYSESQIMFKEKEHAEQAIKMLGDELKYLFEPW